MMMKLFLTSIEKISNRISSAGVISIFILMSDYVDDVDARTVRVYTDDCNELINQRSYE